MSSDKQLFNKTSLSSDMNPLISQSDSDAFSESSSTSSSDCTFFDFLGIVRFFVEEVAFLFDGMNSEYKTLKVSMFIFTNMDKMC